MKAQNESEKWKREMKAWNESVKWKREIKAWNEKMKWKREMKAWNGRKIHLMWCLFIICLLMHILSRNWSFTTQKKIWLFFYSEQPLYLSALNLRYICTVNFTKVNLEYFWPLLESMNGKAILSIVSKLTQSLRICYINNE